jgi:hypothetical protein
MTFLRDFLSERKAKGKQPADDFFEDGEEDDNEIVKMVNQII